MREFKFRAWDTQDTDDDKMISWVDIKNYYNFLAMLDPVYVDYERYKIMQYTGLKDKNNKEIYEGDIIRTTYPDCTAVVTWEEGTVRYIGYTIESERKIIYIDMVDKHDDPAVEVIGNIYGNPELI